VSYDKENKDGSRMVEGGFRFDNILNCLVYYPSGEIDGVKEYKVEKPTECLHFWKTNAVSGVEPDQGRLWSFCYNGNKKDEYMREFMIKEL